MEEEIEKELQRLRESNAFKDKLLAIISHDLKAPMNNIKGLISLLQDDNTPMRDRKELITQLLSLVDTSTQMLENILEWASQKYYGAVLDKTANEEVLNLSEKVDKACAFVQHHAKSKEIMLYNEIPKNVMVIGDRQQILFVLRNLISNAIKFSYLKGTVHIACQIIEGGYVEVSVIDRGVGMSRERIDTMFSIEQRYSQEGTGKEKGAGLALILCKEFVEANGGKITIQSNSNFGTTVKFTIRAAT